MVVYSLVALKSRSEREAVWGKELGVGVGEANFDVKVLVGGEGFAGRGWKRRQCESLGMGIRDWERVTLWGLAIWGIAPFV